MANTRVQGRVEDWIRRNWLSERFGERFFRERVRLTSGGEFDFDAVNEGESIVVNISTSSGMTSGGKVGVGKMMKIRSDLYFLLLASAPRKCMVFTEQSMLDLFEKERRNGRVPASIEFHLAEIPDDLRAELEASRRRASEEVRPGLAQGGTQPE